LTRTQNLQPSSLQPLAADYSALRNQTYSTS
jgi:hypothetical protein